MRAISTKYLGPTNTRGSRILAHDNGGDYEHRHRSVTIGYPHEFSGIDCYAQAALALIRKIEWGKGHYSHTHIVGAGTEQGYVFTFVTLPDGIDPKTISWDIWELPITRTAT